MNAIRNVGEAHVAELHEEAERLTDWREHVRANPWVAMGGAVVGGFLVAQRLFHRPDEPPATRAALQSPPPPAATSGVAALVGSIAGAALRQYALYALRTHLGATNHDRHATGSQDSPMD